ATLRGSNPPHPKTPLGAAGATARGGVPRPANPAPSEPPRRSVPGRTLPATRTQAHAVRCARPRHTAPPRTPTAAALHFAPTAPPRHPADASMNLAIPCPLGPPKPEKPVWTRAARLSSKKNIRRGLLGAGSFTLDRESGPLPVAAA